MKIEFDSTRDSALDAAAVAQAMLVYARNAAPSNMHRPSNPTRQPIPAAAFGTPDIAPIDADQDDDNAPSAAPARSTRAASPGTSAFTPRRGMAGGTLNSDGTWRGKRGVSKELVAVGRGVLCPATSVGATIPATVEAYEAVMTPSPAPVDTPQPPVTIAPPPPAAPAADTSSRSLPS